VLTPRLTNHLSKLRQYTGLVLRCFGVWAHRNIVFSCPTFPFQTDFHVYVMGTPQSSRSKISRWFLTVLALILFTWRLVSELEPGEPQTVRGFTVAFEYPALYWIFFITIFVASSSSSPQTLRNPKLKKRRSWLFQLISSDGFSSMPWLQILHMSRVIII
jgi:hypothetical protein